MNFRIVETLDNDEQVITYFQIHELDKKFFWEYNGEQHGPFESIDDAVDSAYENLIPVSE